MWLVVLVDNLEGEQLDVFLYCAISKVTSDQSFHIKYSIFRVGGQLVLGGVTNQTFTLICESHVRWGDAVSLVIGNDFNTAILVHSNTVRKVDR